MRSFLRRHHFLICFVLLTNLMGISVGMAKVSTSLLSLDLGADATLQGLIASAQSVGIIFVSIPIGFMIDRLGPRRLFVTGSVVVGLIYLLLPLVPSPGLLLLGTALVSLFMPMRFVTLNALFMAQLENMGESKAGWYRGSHMTGMFLVGPVLAALAVEWCGFRGTFWFIGLLFALTIGLSPTVFRHYAVKPVPAKPPRLRDLVPQLARLSRDPELRAISLIEFTAQGINSFYVFFILIIAINQLHLDTLMASHLIAIEGATFILALFVLGGVVQRLGHEYSYLISLLSAALALLALGLGRELPTLLLGGGILGLSLGTLQIINLTRYARLGARLGRGEVSGISSLAGPAGGCLGALCGGWIGHHWGLQHVFLLAIPLLLLLSGWILRTMRQAIHSSVPRTPAPAEPLTDKP